ncbi:MAG: ATP-binding protein [Acidimicrobiales bacterium]
MGQAERHSTQGPGMPEERLVPDIEQPERLDIEGGFGIPLMRTLSSAEVVFDSTPGGTTVHLELWQGTQDPTVDSARD